MKTELQLLCFVASVRTGSYVSCCCCCRKKKDFRFHLQSVLWLWMFRRSRINRLMNSRVFMSVLMVKTKMWRVKGKKKGDEDSSQLKQSPILKKTIFKYGSNSCCWFVGLLTSPARQGSALWQRIYAEGANFRCNSTFSVLRRWITSYRSMSPQQLMLNGQPVPE